MIVSIQLQADDIQHLYSKQEHGLSIEKQH
jgi:hypothetical protein